MRLISAILCLLIGISEILFACAFIFCAVGFTSIFAGVSDSMVDRAPNPEQANAVKMLGNFGTFIGGGLIVCGIIFLLKAFIYIFAAIGGFRKTGSGRVLMLICAILSILSALSYLGGGVSAGSGGAILTSGLAFLLHAAQAVTGFLATIGDQARAEYD
jgi:hypothetical protein